jgi:hypothetical protein
MEWGPMKGGRRVQCHSSALPRSVLNRVNDEGNFGVKFIGDVAEILDGEARTYFVSIDFCNGRGAGFIKQISQYAYKLSFVI